MSFALVFHVIILFVLLQTLVTIGVNLFLFRRPPHSPPPANDPPLISILVPARDEEARLPHCLDSLLAQNYPKLEIIVLDDHSTDGTAAVAAKLGFVSDAGALRRVMSGEVLPVGWTGKAWACHQLARAAHGEFLMFTDADTRHQPECVSSVAAFATQERADLLAPWPRQTTKTWSERLIIPLIGLLILGFMPHVLLWLPQRFRVLARRVPRSWLWGLGGANGQFLFFRRNAYDEIGGHEAVRDHLIEDVALGRRVAARIPDGLRLINCDGSQLVSCRMYESFGGIWEGFTKNLRSAFDTRVGMFIAFGLIQLICFLLPFVMVATPAALGSWWRFAAIEVGLIYLIRIVITLRLGTSWVSVMFHPIAQLFALLIGLNSWRRSRTGVTWKGRTYTMGEASLRSEFQNPKSQIREADEREITR